MTIAVTAASGKLGSEIIRALSRLGTHSVVGLEPSKRVEQHRNVIGAAQDAGVRKIVYTSVQGAMTGTAFSPIVQSNRQTEQDVRDNGLDWVIGRNGICIEPDVECIDAPTGKRDALRTVPETAGVDIRPVPSSPARMLGC
jgi:uncharacterized protein YbjT (DUF2867 family)